MTYERIRPTQYTAAITAATLEQFHHVVRVWDTPQSMVEGARIVYIITMPTLVEVIAEQREPFGDKPERAKIRYQGKEGWVLAMLLTREQ
jgi:hypothetical protein